MAEKGCAGILAGTLARRMVDASLEPVAVAGWPGGRIVYANAAFCRLAGRDAGAVENAGLPDILTGFDPAMLEQAARTGQAATNAGHPLAVGEGAETRWWDLRSVAFPADDAGTVIVTTAHDVTDSHAARERARLSTERLDLALQAGGLGIWETDYAAGLTSWDHRLAQIFAFTAERRSAQIGQMMAFIHADDRDRVQVSFEEAIRTLQPFASEFRVVSTAGETRWLSTRGIFAGGRAIGVARDVTQRKIREERLEQALLERDLLMREADHRIKNSLQLIANLLTLQQRRLPDPQGRAALSDAIARVHAVGETHRSLYQSRDFKTVDFGQTLTDLCAHIGRLTASVQIDCQAKDGLQLDAERAIPLGLLVGELLTNAAKHAYPGSGGKVSAYARASPDEMIIEVADEGTGLADRQAEERGLGSSIVRRLAEQIGASVETDSSPGKGTRVTIRLPRAADGSPDQDKQGR